MYANCLGRYSRKKMPCMQHTCAVFDSGFYIPPLPRLEVVFLFWVIYIIVGRNDACAGMQFELQRRMIGKDFIWSSEWEDELVVGNGWTASIERISILLIDCVISLNWHIDWSEKSVWIQICMESRCGRCWRLHRLHFGAFNELWWRFDSNQNFYLSVEDWFVDAKNEKVNLTSEKRFFTCGFILFWPIFSCGSELSSKSSFTMFANNNAMIE